jgi:hypothetical protein
MLTARYRTGIDPRRRSADHRPVYGAAVNREEVMAPDLKRLCSLTRSSPGARVTHDLVWP